MNVFDMAYAVFSGILMAFTVNAMGEEITREPSGLLDRPARGGTFVAALLVLAALIGGYHLSIWVWNTGMDMIGVEG